MTSINDILFALGGESSDDEELQADNNDQTRKVVFHLTEEDDDDDNKNKDDSSGDGNDANADADAGGEDEVEDEDGEIYPVASQDNKFNVPPLSKWIEADLYEEATITVAKAKRNLWIQMIEEVKLIKKNISELTLPSDVASLAAFPFYKVYQTLFGTSSLLCSNFCRQLQILKIKYLHFLFTFLYHVKINSQQISCTHRWK